jgi:peptidoglycan hydrolase CwlO-like protein
LPATVLALAKAETITLVGTATTALEEQLHKVTKHNKALMGMVKKMAESITDLNQKVAEYQASFEHLQGEHQYFVSLYDEHILEHKAIREAAAKSDSPQIQPHPENAGPDGDRTPEAKRPRIEETTVASGSDTNREAVNAATSGQPSSCPASILVESL